MSTPADQHSFAQWKPLLYIGHIFLGFAQGQFLLKGPVLQHSPSCSIRDVHSLAAFCFYRSANKAFSEAVNCYNRANPWVQILSGNYPFVDVLICNYCYCIIPGWTLRPSHVSEHAFSWAIFTILSTASVTQARKFIKRFSRFLNQIPKIYYRVMWDAWLECPEWQLRYLLVISIVSNHGLRNNIRLLSTTYKYLQGNWQSLL